MPSGRRGRSTASATSADLVSANEQIDLLQQALSAVRAECARLRAKDLQTQLSDLGALPLPSSGGGSSNGQLTQVLKDSITLVRQAHIVAAQPMIVDITHSGKKVNIGDFLLTCLEGLMCLC